MTPVVGTLDKEFETTPNSYELVRMGRLLRTSRSATCTCAKRRAASWQNGTWLEFIRGQGL